MAQTLFGRLRERYPGVTIRVVTRDAAGHTRHFPDTVPVVVGDRVYWSIFGDALRLAEVDGDSVPAFGRLARVERRIQELFPAELEREINERDSSSPADTMQGLLAAVAESDAVFLMGGGYFSESFAPHARFLMASLRAAIEMGKPAFVCGCGFEPVEDALLRAEAQWVLPRVSLIGCREELLSPQVLEAFGVRPERMVVTGDDAFEFAFRRRPQELGAAIGVNLRAASYSGVSVEDGSGRIDAIRESLKSLADELSAPLLAAPVSNYDPDDLAAIECIVAADPTLRLTTGRPDTPELLAGQIAQCRVVVTGSYHAAVFALSMGIPTVCLAQSGHYRSKMNGLTGLLDAGRVVYLDEPDLAQRLQEAVRGEWASGPERREKLLARVSTYVEKNRSAFGRMCDLLDENLAMPAGSVEQEPTGVSADEAATAFALAVSYNRQIRQLRELASFFEYHATSRMRQLEELRAEHAALQVRVEALIADAPAGIDEQGAVDVTPAASEEPQSRAEGSLAASSNEPGRVDDGKA